MSTDSGTSPTPGRSMQDAYDAWAAQYDVKDPRVLNAEVSRKQDFIESNDDMLELGCGTDLDTEWLAAQAGHIVATDVSDKMLAQARARIDPESVTLQHLDVTESWPFETNRFDTVSRLRTDRQRCDYELDRPELSRVEAHLADARTFVEQAKALVNGTS